jgi:hypothetical protein
MFALPLAIISSNFGEYEKHSQRREKVLLSLRAENHDDYNLEKKRKFFSEKDI